MRVNCSGATRVNGVKLPQMQQKSNGGGWEGRGVSCPAYKSAKLRYNNKGNNNSRGWHNEKKLAPLDCPVSVSFWLIYDFLGQKCKKHFAAFANKAETDAHKIYELHRMWACPDTPPLGVDRKCKEKSESCSSFYLFYVFK